MKKIFSVLAYKTFTCFLLFSYLLVPGTYLMAQSFIYAKGFSNSTALQGNVVTSSIKADDAGNTYVTGYFTGTADFDLGNKTINTISAGSYDIFIAKYDASGNYVFAKSMGGTNADYGYAIAIDGQGSIYVTGKFSGNADFDPSTGTAALTSAGNSDVFVAKYDASGNYIYAKRIGGAGEDAGNGVAVDGSGNVYITGNFSGAADFDPGTGFANLTSAGGSDLFVARYDYLGNYVFAKSAGSVADDNSNSIALGGMGNIYITGYFSSTVDFDPGAATANLSSAGGSDIFVARYDAYGNYVYAKPMGGTNDDAGNSVAVDGSGNAFVTGYFSGTADFNPGVAVSSLTSAGRNDMFIARYDATGNYVYAKAIGGSDNDAGNGIAVDGSDNAFVTGYFANTTDFDPGSDIANLTSAGGSDIFVSRYDASGNYVYAKAVGGTGADVGYGIAVNSADNGYISGSFMGIADFDPGTAVKYLGVEALKINGFILSLNTAGNYTYVNQLGNYINNGYGEQGNSVAVDAAGNTYVTGYFSKTVDFDPGPGTAYLTAVGFVDIFIAKYDASGNYVYAKSIGGTDVDMGNAIAVDNHGNVYITGSFFGPVDFDPGVGTAYMNTKGIYDAFIAKYDANGNYVYAKDIGGADYQTCCGYGIAVDGSGNVYVTGSFFGTVDFDPGPGTYNRTSTGSNDIFIARYDPSCNFFYAKTIGSTGNDQGNGITVDASGRTYITGYFSGMVDFDPGAGTANVTSAGGADIFIASFDALGNYIYAKGIGGNAGNDNGYSIAVDGSQNVYVTGNFYSTADFDPGVATANLTSAGESEIFMAKYDVFGNYLFAKAMGGTDRDVATGIALDRSGNIYITGYFTGTADFDPGPNISNQVCAGFTDIFIAKYNAFGNYVYAKAMGAHSDDYGYGIAVDGSGNASITGSYRDTVNFDRDGSDANAIIVAPIFPDVFIAKYGPSAILPVQLVSFTATASGNGTVVQIHWLISAQTNNAYFDVERSKDGQHFEPVARMQGCASCTGDHHYNVNDSNPYTGISYYRLKQVDNNNEFSYGPVAIVNIADRIGATIQIYPSITDGPFTVVFKNNQSNKQVIIQLHNTAGDLVNEQRAWLQVGDNKLNYTVDGLASGVYYISIKNKQSITASTIMLIKK